MIKNIHRWLASILVKRDIRTGEFPSGSVEVVWPPPYREDPDAFERVTDTAKRGKS